MEKINIVELLKDCPKGMELDCVIYDNLYFNCIREHPIYPITCWTVDSKGDIHDISFNWYGKSSSVDTAKCVIFPKGKTTWEGFVPPCKFKDGDIVIGSNSCCSYIAIYKGFRDKSSFYCHAVYNSFGKFKTNDYADNLNLRFADEREKERLFDEIKAKGYKWNEETRTLEKLVEPKFKDGDRVREIDTCEIHIIDHITASGYVFQDEGGMGFIFENEHIYELVPNKFDINTLKPFESRVLVRDSWGGKWRPAFFGYFECKGMEYTFIAVGGLSYNFCIPYKGNEHLLGTAKDCDEYYKIWEE